MTQVKPAAPAAKPALTPAQLVEAWFTSLPQSEEQQKRSQNIRDAAKTMAGAILANVQPCADQTAMLRKLREISMTGVQAITLEEVGK